MRTFKTKVPLDDYHKIYGLKKGDIIYHNLKTDIYFRFINYDKKHGIYFCNRYNNIFNNRLVFKDQLFTHQGYYVEVDAIPIKRPIGTIIKK